MIPCIYDDAVTWDGLVFISVKKDGKWGCINERNGLVVPFEYDYVDRFSSGLASVKRNGKYGFVNEKGEEVISCKYDRVGDFNGAYINVTENGREFTINGQGQECRIQ